MCFPVFKLMNNFYFTIILKGEIIVLLVEYCIFLRLFPDWIYRYGSLCRRSRFSEIQCPEVDILLAGDANFLISEWNFSEALQTLKFSIPASGQMDITVSLQ